MTHWLIFWQSNQVPHHNLLCTFLVLTRHFSKNYNKILIWALWCENDLSYMMFMGYCKWRRLALFNLFFSFNAPKTKHFLNFPSFFLCKKSYLKQIQKQQKVVFHNKPFPPSFPFVEWRRAYALKTLNLPQSRKIHCEIILNFNFVCAKIGLRNRHKIEPQPTCL